MHIINENEPVPVSESVTSKSKSRPYIKLYYNMHIIKTLLKRFGDSQGHRGKLTVFMLFFSRIARFKSRSRIFCPVKLTGSGSFA